MNRNKKNKICEQPPHFRMMKYFMSKLHMHLSNKPYFASSIDCLPQTLIDAYIYLCKNKYSEVEGKDKT